jgi:hypothetical protein
MNRAAHARRLILQFLQDAAPHALPENELMTRVDARVGHPVGIHDFTIHIGWLWEQKLIQKLDGDFGDDEKRWTVTRAGEAYLAR